MSATIRLTRCLWAPVDDPLYVAYHDEEWGVPVHDEVRLFEMLNLEGAQAGLSWRTILRKRENYRQAFDGWDVARIARYSDARVARLLMDPGIVRNRLKVHAVAANARAVGALRQAGTSFDALLWSFVGGTPRQARRRSMRDVPARTAASEAMSKSLRQRGFRFVGPTICHAFMQAVGMVNDHLTDCFRHEELALPGSGAKK
jgi:DNA-3-methyladenine glycosylase I